MTALVFYFVAVLSEESSANGNVSLTGLRGPVASMCDVSSSFEVHDGPSIGGCRKSDAPWPTEDFAVFGPYFTLDQCAVDRDVVVSRRNPWGGSGMSECYAREVLAPVVR